MRSRLLSSAIYLAAGASGLLALLSSAVYYGMKGSLLTAGLMLCVQVLWSWHYLWQLSGLPSPFDLPVEPVWRGALAVAGANLLLGGVVGFFSKRLSLAVLRNGFTWITNEIPFLLAPRIELSWSAAPHGALSLQVTCRPRLRLRREARAPVGRRLLAARRTRRLPRVPRARLRRGRRAVAQQAGSRLDQHGHHQPGKTQRAQRAVFHLLARKNIDQVGHKQRSNRIITNIERQPEQVDRDVVVPVEFFHCVFCCQNQVG